VPRRRHRAPGLVARIASAVPSCMAAGIIKSIPLWRCSWLYQWKNCWQCARASPIEPTRSGKSGRYFWVFNCASEYGLSSVTHAGGCGSWPPPDRSAEPRQALSACWCAIGVQCERPRCDVLLLQGLGDQLLGELYRSPLREHPSDDVSAEDVEDDLQVKARPVARTLHMAVMPVSRRPISSSVSNARPLRLTMRSSTLR